MTVLSSVRRLANTLARCPAWVGDLGFALAMATLIAVTLGVGFLNSQNSPTGGDAASHLFYAWIYGEDLLFSGEVTPWLPEVFGGLPFLSYYFPMPFIVIAVLTKLLGLAPAFKWGAFLAAMLLPGAVFTFGRRWLGFSWPAALFSGLGALAFLLHEQNSIWGGNLLSTLAGEFAYSYGLFFAVLAMMAWLRAISLGRGWILAALLEAASGFSHGFPLLIVGFSSIFLLLDGGFGAGLLHLRTNFWLLLRGHLLAFCLLGGWLWPMLEMHGLTIPNDASFPLKDWRDLLPATLWPVAGAGLVGLALLAVPAVRRCWGTEQARAARYFVSAAGLAAVGFVAGDQIGVADIRFFPMVWLFGAIVCGWLAGQALVALGALPGRADRRLIVIARALLAGAAGIGLIGWIGQHVLAAPDWGLWNHAGLQSKPQWNNLSKLFPAMRGELWSPRLVFEHDPANNDLGSTRTLEALPMFLDHRPVLEGLYMESALLGPAIYQLQSEVSARPSSPLVRFPSGSLDADFAARHMNFLHADTLLLRSSKAREAIEASGHFVRIAEAPPFFLYRLKDFNSHLAEVITKPVKLCSNKDWMQDAFIWFRTRSLFDACQPVYRDDASSGMPGIDEICSVAVTGAGFAPAGSAAAAAAYPVVEKLLSRNELIFETKAVGSPHLIKIAYHPRWQLASRGSLNIAAPGFMTVTPAEQEIRLVYGHTLVGKLGMAATIVAALSALFLGWKSRSTVIDPGGSSVAQSHPGWRDQIPLLIGLGLLAATGTYFALLSPEQVYTRAWEAMRADRHIEASGQFWRAYELRRPPAKKEEALFWSAKASELAGQRALALARYRELGDHYHGYWVPESLFNVILLERLEHRPERSDLYARRLREEYPNNPWTLKLEPAK